jgi:hypothetical protein
MSFLKFFSRRLARRPARLHPAIEGLEPRQLLSGSPAVRSLQVLGNVHHVNRIVLTFDESLDPTTAQQPKSYSFGRVPASGSDNGVTIGDVLGFLAKPKVPAVKGGKIQWSSATYDDATHSVTLTAVKAFNASQYFRLLRVKGTGNYAVKDLTGRALNGGADTVVRWAYRTGKTLRFVEADGDTAVLTLKGPGQLYGFFRKSGDPDPTVFVSNTNSKSVLTGTVNQARMGNGVVNIAQVLGAPAKTNLFSSSQFVVGGT